MLGKGVDGLLNVGYWNNSLAAPFGRTTKRNLCFSTPREELRYYDKHGPVELRRYRKLAPHTTHRAYDKLSRKPAGVTIAAVGVDTNWARDTVAEKTGSASTVKLVVVYPPNEQFWGQNFLIWVHGYVHFHKYCIVNKLLDCIRIVDPENPSLTLEYTFGAK